ncbi:hypothetical protein EB118_05305 [bacterium]|nr:hypothetical protein [bacterium]NDC93753.1 hypothetical protein [bacterium]NDD83086.1 hypothetical protein [bacterium]NDG29501.1 hypothetical protein [bacterium]
MKLPIEIIERIIEFADDYQIAMSLQDVISNSALSKFEKHILIHGHVQGGKTKAIFDILHKTRGLKVVVVQNSLLVLQQYKTRLENEGIRAQVIEKTTMSLTCDTVLVMANFFRYSYFRKHVKHENFTLIVDEADQIYSGCPFTGKKTYFVTATPQSLESKVTFHKRIYLEVHPNYYGLNKINVQVSEYNDALLQFLDGPKGMMLMNHLDTVVAMEELAITVANSYPEIPVVFLTSDKRIYYRNNVINVTRIQSITRIIDSLSEHNHIIFIANRLSNRGLSYTSSDYTRHLTCQYTRLKRFTQFYQSLRILGIYKDNPKLTLFVESDHERKSILALSKTQLI